MDRSLILFRKMVEIRKVERREKELVRKVVQIHMDTFQGFFLTFMGRGFLRQMYSSYCAHEHSGLYVALDDEEPIGFLAYSSDMSGLYRYMIRTKLIMFAWYSIGAFLRKPSVFIRLIRAFLKPSESKRTEKYVELSSIGVRPDDKSRGIGTQLIGRLVSDTDFNSCSYISLETDADNNEGANKFYQKNGFALERTYLTHEGRKMNEYRYSPERSDVHENALHIECSQ